MPRRALAVPPFQRIADDLRRRIERAELRPGDRLPSTRELAREHDVALATATRALRTLADAGLVRGVPRVGTVVAGAPARRGSAAVTPADRGAPLTRERIVRAAIAIADAEGLAAVSLRGVAARLDAPVMSLYRHVASKAELLREMTDSALGEVELPAVPPPGWRAQLELAGRAQWTLFRRHPWVARLLSVTRPTPLANAIAYAEWVLRALDGHGLDAERRMQLHIVMHGMIQGFATNLETEAEAAGETGLTDDEWMAGQLEPFAALARSGRFPVFAAVLHDLGADSQLHLDAVFELGLATLLDGFARALRVRS